MAASNRQVSDQLLYPLSVACNECGPYSGTNHDRSELCPSDSDIDAVWPIDAISAASGPHETRRRVGSTIVAVAVDALLWELGLDPSEPPDTGRAWAVRSHHEQ